MKVLEVGCGTGAMTEWLAKQVGEKGKLTAIDISPNYVSHTQKRVQSFSHCEVLLKDVHELKSLQQTFDLIYYRMVLHHLPDPENVLLDSIACLNKTGVLICEEPPTIKDIFTFPKSTALRKMEEWVINCFQQNHSDYEIPYRIASIMKKANLTIKLQQIFQPLLNQEQRKLHLMGLREIAPQLIAYKIASQADIDQMAQIMENELKSADAVSHLKMFQIAGTK